MIKNLMALGLSDDEAAVYVALLELGGAYVSQVAKRAGKQRATCYHTLANLQQKGLVTKFEKGKYQFFAPEAPETLERQVEQKLEVAKNLIPELHSIENTRTGKPKIRFYERASGIEEIFADTLSADEEILGYTNLSFLVTLFPDYFRKYTKEKLKRGIKTRYLSPHTKNPNKIIEKFVPKSFDRDLLEILFIDPKQYPFSNEIAIYGNKVAVMSLSKEEQIAILVESRTFSDTMRAVFDLAWLGATAFVAEQ